MSQNIKTYLQFNPYYIDALDWNDLMWDRFEVKFEKLSLSLKDILISAKTSLFIDGVLGQMGLNISQGQKLSRVIRDIILGDVYLGDMINIIQDNLGVDKDKAKNIASLFISQLSKEALEELKKLHTAKFGQREVPPLPKKPEATNNPNIIDLRNNQ